MSEPFISTIMLWPANFAPRGWAFCYGQILSIAQNTALFSLLGTVYGGNGQTTFALPDLRGRVPLGTGQGPGLAPYSLGEIGGTETITLTTAQMPMHNHAANFTSTPGLGVSVKLNASENAATTDKPAAGLQLGDAVPNTTRIYTPTAGNQVELGGVVAALTGAVTGTVTVGLAGGSLPVPNQQPYLALNYVIALQGIFPSRN